MIGRLAALILLSTLSHTTDIPHQVPLTVAEVGENVTLSCPMIGDESGLFYWYKLRSGYMVQTIAAGSLYKISLQGQFNSSRFAFTKANSLYFLHLTHVSKDDEATYICQSGAAYTITFTNATVLVVKEPKNQRKSLHVRQTPETTSLQPDESMTLQCSVLSRNEEDPVQCPSEQNVYWFRAGSGESHPSIIYTDGNRRDECEERSDTQKSCVYHFSNSVSSSDAGTYYCAVATCGEILFGNGTEVEIERRVSSEFIALVTAVVCLVISVIGNIVFIFYRTSGPTGERFKGTESTTSEGRCDNSHQLVNDNTEGGLKMIYAALNFSGGKVTRRQKKKELMIEGSVYSVCVYECL